MVLDGQRIDSIAWSEDGATLAVLTADQSSAEGVLWTVDATTLGSRARYRSSALMSLAGVAYGPSGISWVERDGDRAGVWVFVGETARRLIDLPSPVYGLHETGQGFFGLAASADPPTIVKINWHSSDTSAVFEPVFEPRQTIESFDIDRQGKTLVSSESRGPGEVVAFVMRVGEREVARIRPEGDRATNPTLSLDSSVVYYESHDRATFERIVVATGIADKLLEIDVSEAQVWQDDQVAFTFVHPLRTNTLCIESVA